jgi:signal transduction histidine kinase
LQFILEQLIANAANAMPDRGRIQVTVRPIDEEPAAQRCVVHQACDYTVITVADNGLGMSTRTQSKIFTPFFVGHRKPNPVGLGLSAASNIVKRHGGYIQVKSEKGAGSTFKIYLPTLAKVIVSKKSTIPIKSKT